MEREAVWGLGFHFFLSAVFPRQSALITSCCEYLFSLHRISWASCLSLSLLLFFFFYFRSTTSYLTREVLIQLPDEVGGF